MIDILTPDGLLTGEKASRKEVHAKGLFHRTVHIHIIDAAGRTIIQKRSPKVDNFPNILAISAAGHVDTGELSLETALRELQEELGLHVSPEELEFLFSYRQEKTLRADYIDRQFNDVYLLSKDYSLEELQIDPNEVESVQYMPFLEFVERLERRDPEVGHLAYRDECQSMLCFPKIRSLCKLATV